MGYEAKSKARTKKSIDSALKDTAGRGMDINEPGNQMLLRRLGQTQVGSPQLEQVIKGRLREMYGANQIPAAEHEADLIASSVSGASTPEDVKAALGAKMGADFSGVEFHMDAEAAARAGNIGAKAYTVGSDIYFKGGFDPMTAAHELVHTVQQGMVDSAVPTTSVPEGSVQMKQDGGGGGLFGWLKKLVGKGGGAPQSGVHADLDLSGASQSQSLKGKTVTSMPTVTGEKAVVKAATNPAVEEALADFYNVASSVRAVDHPSSWSFDAPEARALRESERPGVRQLYEEGKLATRPWGVQPPTEEQVRGTTVFRLVGGKSIKDPRGDGAQDDKKRGELHRSLYKGSDLRQYQETMGYITLLDFLAGNNDRHSNINFNNWMEDREQKRIHLIDNDPLGSPQSHGFSMNIEATQRTWQNSARRMFGADTEGGPSAQKFMRNWLHDTSGGEIYSRMFGERGLTGVSQALGDLPTLRAALEARFQQQAGSTSPERARINQAILERFDMLRDILNPMPQKPTRPAPRPKPSIPQKPPKLPVLGEHRKQS